VYTRQIRALPLTSLLSHRRKMVKHVVSTPQHTFVHIVEDLVDFSLIYIEQPIGSILDTLVVTPPTSNYCEPKYSESEEERSYLESFDYGSKYMGGNNENKKEGENQLGNNQPWLARDALALLG
jgi:hypothetical protein